MVMIDFETQPIYSIFAETAKRRKVQTAVFYFGTGFSYGQVMDLAERFAAALGELGIGSGQRVMLYIPNSIQWVVAWLGSQRIGAVPVPITPIYTPHDLSYIASDSGAECTVCSDTNFGYVSQVLSKTGLKTVIVSNMVDLLPAWKRAFGFLFNVVPRGEAGWDGRVYPIRRLLSKHSHYAGGLPEPGIGGSKKGGRR